MTVKVTDLSSLKLSRDDVVQIFGKIKPMDVEVGLFCQRMN